MLPGPILYKKCSECSVIFKERAFGSGNTFGATYWTDGRMNAPMMVDDMSLAICPNCKTPVWLEELETVGSTTPWLSYFSDAEHQAEAEKENSEIAKLGATDAEFCIEPFSDDYSHLLNQGIEDPVKELYVRLQLWWESNDSRRGKGRPFAMHDEEIANVQALILLLDESDEHQLMMKAEALREIGKFEDALLILEKSTNPEFASVVDFMKNLCVNADPFVRKIELNFDNEETP